MRMNNSKAICLLKLRSLPVAFFDPKVFWTNGNRLTS